MSPVIGKSLPRKEDLRLVTGGGRYSDDVSLLGEVHAVFVRSPHAHARNGASSVRTSNQRPGKRTKGLRTGSGGPMAPPRIEPAQVADSASAEMLEPALQLSFRLAPQRHQGCGVFAEGLNEEVDEIAPNFLHGNSRQEILIFGF